MYKELEEPKYYPELDTEDDLQSTLDEVNELLQLYDQVDGMLNDLGLEDRNDANKAAEELSSRIQSFEDENQRQFINETNWWIIHG